MKELIRYGVSGKDYQSKEDASGDTYVTNDGKLIPTPLIFPDNPFNDDVKNAKHILDLGCGIGRNLSWIMENTNAHYWGLDPNETMLRFFWDMQDVKYKDRVTLWTKFEDTPPPADGFDIVVSTFVFQHITYRPEPPIMHVGDITTEVRKYTRDGCVWILLEHDSEEQWIDWWFTEQNITPDVYIRSYKGIEELTHRDRLAPHGGHHLIIWKESK